MTDASAAADLWSLGRKAWPALALEESRFQRYVASHAGREAPSPACAGDLYLACACLHDVPGAIAAFEEAFGDDIARAIRRVSSEGGEDLGQIVRQRLFTEITDGPKIAQYAGRAPLRHWLRVVVARTAHNARRKRVEAPIEETLVQALVADARSPEARLIETSLIHEYKAAFEEAFHALDPAERTLLRFSVKDQLGIDDIATILKVHRATAARRVAAARAKLGDLTKASVMTRNKLTTEEFESAVRVIRSQIDLSLQRMFASDPPL